tara:strand:+ start:126 stop:566 length:441 start_codon:yes stop_codon:yes gene_type:complete
MNSLYTEITTILTSCGFKEEKVNNSSFVTSFTRKKLLGNLVFLIKNIDTDSSDSNLTKQIVDAGREWCLGKSNGESGLNLILFHDGQVQYDHIKGQVDSTFIHKAICQSITGINTRNGALIQEKTWVVIGAVRKALKLMDMKNEKK